MRAASKEGKEPGGGQPSQFKQSVNANSLGQSGTKQTYQQQNKQLSQDYAEKYKRMRHRIDNEIQKNAVIKDAVTVAVPKQPKALAASKDPTQELLDQIDKKHRKMNRALSSKKNSKAQAKENRPVESKPGEANELDLIPDKDAGGRSSSQLARESDDSSAAKPKTYSYVRSQRQVRDIIKDKFDLDAQSIEQDKFHLVKRLNEHLLQLDKMNEEKRNLSQELIEKIKFVRDLQSQLGTADNGHVTEVIDKELEHQFRKEKQLNIQMKEKLKESEIEKCQILEQLKFLEGQKDVTVVTQSGTDVDLKKSLMSVDEMLQYRTTIVKNLDEVNKDLDLLRVDEEAAVRAIDHLQAKLQQTSEARAKAAADIQLLQGRLDDGTVLIRRDNFDLRFELNRQRALLGFKVISRALQKIVKKRQVDHFSFLVHQIEQDDQQIGSILAFRRFCIRYRQRRQQKYFDIWFARGLRPMSLVRQNREVTLFQQRAFFVQKFFRHWRLQQLKSSKQASHQMQTIERFLFCFKTFQKRKLKHALEQWHRNSSNILLGKSKLAKFIIEKMLTRCRQAIRKWQCVVTFDDYLMRVNSACTRAAHMQYKTQLFQAWRQRTVALRARRLVRIIRAWNQLDKFRVQSKRKKAKVQLVLQHDLVRQRYLLAACFSEMAVILRAERNQRYRDKLAQEVEPAIEAEAQAIREAVLQTQRKKRQRIMHLIMLCCAGRVYECLHRWREQTRIHQRMVRENTRSRILNLHRARMYDAFTKWAHIITFERKRKKKILNDQLYQEREVMESELHAAKQKVEGYQVRSKRAGRQSATKLAQKLYLDRLGHRFRQWHAAIRERDDKTEKIERVVARKFTRRMLKLAFARYKEKMKIVRREQFSGKRGEDYERVIKYRAMKRMFKGIRKFQQDYHIAKANLRKLVRNIDLKTKKSVFSLWYREIDVEVEELRVKEQSRRVQRLQQSVVSSGNLQSIAHDQMIKIKETDKAMVSMSRKTLAKTINRFKMYQIYTAFTTWREKVEEYRRCRQKLTYQIVQRLLNRSQFAAFETWRAAHKAACAERRRTQMKQVQQMQMEAEDAVQGVGRKRKQVQQVRSKKMTQLKDKQNYHKKKQSNIVERITKMTQNNDYIPRRQHVFNMWRDHVQQKKKWTKRLAQLMLTNHYQYAFNGIKQEAWKHKSKEGKISLINKMITVLMKRRYQFYFHRWKGQLMKVVNATRLAVGGTLHHEQQNSMYSRQKRTSKVVDSQVFTLKRNIKKNCFIALYDHRCKKLADHENLRQMREKLQGMRCRQAVQIWRARAKLTVVERKRKLDVHMLLRAYYLRKCYQTMKNQFLKSKNGSRAFDNLAKFITGKQKRFAMEQLKHGALSFYQADRHKKFSGKNLLKHMLERQQNTQLRRYFDKFKNSMEILSNRDRTLRSIFGKALGDHQRHCFEIWKKQTAKQQTVEKCHDYGEQRVVLVETKKKIEILKEMLYKDGYTREEVTDILKSDDKKYKEVIERALCRLFTYGEGQQGHSKLYLLPWCIDKWRTYVKERKAYRYWLRVLEARLHSEGHNKRMAFEKWAIVIQGHKGELKGWQYKWLRTNDYYNRRRVKDQTESMEAKQKQINDLRNQRTFLIQKVVSAQRLALARCQDSYANAQQAAWRKFVRHTSIATKNQVLNHTQRNLKIIEDLKERMAKLQAENEATARENDRLRVGAIASVKSVQAANALQVQVEDMSVALAEKAVTIRRLLEANSQLSHQISQYTHR